MYRVGQAPRRSRAAVELNLQTALAIVVASGGAAAVAGLKPGSALGAVAGIAVAVAVVVVTVRLAMPAPLGLIALWTGAMIVGGQPVAQLGPGPIYPTEVVFGAAGLALVWRWMQAGKIDRNPAFASRWTQVSLLVFLAAATIAMLRGISGYGQYALRDAGLGYLLLAVIVTWWLRDDRRSQDSFLRVWFVASLLAAIPALLHAKGATRFGPLGYEVGFVLLLALAFLLDRWMNGEAGFWGKVWVVLVPVVAATAVVSRSGLWSIAIGALVVTALNMRVQRARLAVLGVIVVGAAGILGVYSVDGSLISGTKAIQEVNSTVTLASNQKGDNARFRLDAAQQLLSQSIQSPVRLLFGAGFGRPSNFVAFGQVWDTRTGSGGAGDGTVSGPHDGVVDAIYRMGWPAALVLVAMILALCRWTLRNLKMAEREDGRALRCLLAIVVAGSFVTVTSDGLRSPEFAVPFACALALLAARNATVAQTSGNARSRRNLTTTATRVEPERAARNAMVVKTSGADLSRNLTTTVARVDPERAARVAMVVKTAEADLSRNLSTQVDRVDPELELARRAFQTAGAHLEASTVSGPRMRLITDDVSVEGRAAAREGRSAGIVNRVFLRRVARGAALALLLQVVGAGLTYGSQIALARWMGIKEFGIYIYAIAWVTILAGPAGLGLPQSVLRLIPEYRAQSDNARLRGLLRGAGIVTVLLGIGFGSVGTLVAVVLGGSSGTNVWFLVTAACLIPTLALITLDSAIARAFRVRNGGVWRVTHPPSFGAYRRSRGVLGHPRLTISRRELVITLVSLTGVALVQLMTVRRHVRPLISDSGVVFEWRAWLRVSLPLVLVTSFALLLSQTDILVIGAMHGPHDAAVYSAASKTSLLVVYVLAAVNAMTAPIFSELYVKHDQPGMQRLAAVSAQWTFWPSLLIATAIAAVSTQVLALFGSGFGAGRGAVIVLLAGQLVNAACGTVGILLTMTGHQTDVAKVYGITMVLNIALCSVGSYYGGLAGAAGGTTLSMVIWNLWLTRLTKRRVGVRASIVSSIFVLQGGPLHAARQAFGSR